MTAYNLYTLVAEGFAQEVHECSVEQLVEKVQKYIAMKDVELPTSASLALLNHLMKNYLEDPSVSFIQVTEEEATLDILNGAGNLTVSLRNLTKRMNRKPSLKMVRRKEELKSL